MASLNFDFCELKDEYSDPDKIAEMIEKEDESVRGKYKALHDKNPEEFAYLYQMKNGLKLDAGDKVAIGMAGDRMALLFSDKKEGREQFHITTMKEDEDGRIGGSINMKDEQAATMKKEDMEKLVSTIEGTGIDVSTLNSSNENLSRLLDALNEMIGRGSIDPVVMDQLNSEGAKLTGDASKKYLSAVEAMQKEIKEKLGKRIGHECQYSMLRDCYEIYQEDYSLMDRKERKKAVPEARFYRKKTKDGKPVFQYHIKKNGKMSDDIANMQIAMLKDQGYDSVNLSKVIDFDKGTLRDAAAKKGIVPTGIYIDANTAKEMIKKASEKLSSKDLDSFKLRLVTSMREYNKANGKENDDDNAFFSTIMNEHRNAPLADAWDNGGLKRSLADKTRVGDQAEDTLAGIYSMTKVLNAYKDFNSVKELLDFPVGKKTENPSVEIFSSLEEKNRIATIFAGRNDLKISELSASDMKMMFNTFMEEGKKRAEKELLGAYENNVKSSTTRQHDKTIISWVYDPAKNTLSQTLEELEKAGCKLSLPTMTPPSKYQKGKDLENRLKDEMDKKKENKTNEAKTEETPKKEGNNVSMGSVLRQNGGR